MNEKQRPPDGNEFIINLYRTELEAFLLASSRILAALWLEKHPESENAKKILERSFHTLRGDEIDSLLTEIAPDVKDKLLKQE